MTLKAFLSLIFYGVTALTFNALPLLSMMDTLPPPPALSAEASVPIVPPSSEISAMASPAVVGMANSMHSHKDLTNIQTLALPSSYKIESGDMSVSAPDAHTLQITQLSSFGVINWSHFNVGLGETVRFLHPDQNGITVNRIDPASGPSIISGNIQSNGNVAFLNPSGVTFGPTSNIEVHGILATTAQITRQDLETGLQTGRYNFTRSGGSGSIINQGNITLLEGGFAALMAKTVDDTGAIMAKFGSVVLGGAETFVLDFNGDRLISFEIKGIDPSLSTETGSPHVSHSGTLIAEKGQVLITTKEARKFVFEDTVNMEKTPEATTATQQNGVIVLTGKISVDGSSGGSVRVESGKTLDLEGANLSANGHDEKGGSLKVLGPNIDIKTSSLSATGKQGGGSVFVGGGFQGKNQDMENSTKVVVDKGTVTDVSATHTGDAGETIFWSDGTTSFQGTLTAKGGEFGGNGGKLEVSGKEYLDFRGKGSTEAPLGKWGSLLLDPKNLTIDVGGVPYNDGFNNRYGNNVGASTTIDPGTLLDIGNIILQANTDVTINAAINLNAGQSLAIGAGRSVIIHQNIITTNENITIQANDSGAIAGDRDAGVGNIEIDSGVVINAGTGGDIDLSIDPTNGGGFSPGEIQTILGNDPVDIDTQGAGNITLSGDIRTSSDLRLTSGGSVMLLTPYTLQGQNGTENVTIIGNTISVNNASNLALLHLMGANLTTFTGETISVGVFNLDSVGNVATLQSDMTFTTTGNMTFNVANIHSNGITPYDLTLNVGGQLSSTFFGQDGELKSLRITGASNSIGTANMPVNINLNDDGVSPLLFLGSESGGYFAGKIHGDPTASAAEYAELIEGNGGTFYVNGAPVETSSSGTTDATVDVYDAARENTGILYTIPNDVVKGTTKLSEFNEHNNHISIEDATESDSKLFNSTKKYYGWGFSGFKMKTLPTLNSDLSQDSGSSSDSDYKYTQNGWWVSGSKMNTPSPVNLGLKNAYSDLSQDSGSSSDSDYKYTNKWNF